jgi:hypothetical protein
MPQQALELLEGFGAERRLRTSSHLEAQRPVEHRKLSAPAASGLTFAQAESDAAWPPSTFVLERHGVTMEPDHAGRASSRRRSLGHDRFGASWSGVARKSFQDRTPSS